MSRTFKDAPAARKGRRDRLADRERPFDYQPNAVPVTVAWDDLAEAATQGAGGRIRPTAEQRILELLADDPAVRAELTVFANF